MTYYEGHHELDDVYFVTLPPGEYPLRASVVCLREGSIPRCNIPFLVDHIQGAMMNWGYDGTGPRALALNIGHHYSKYLVEEGYRFELMKLDRGAVFKPIWEMRRELLKRFLIQIPPQGGEIMADEILDWMRGKLGEMGITPTV
jgi:hypothetical protein